MNALLNFSIRLTFVLLMINSVFLAARSTGVYTDVGVSQLSEKVSKATQDLNILTSVSVQDKPLSGLVALVNAIINNMGIVADLLWNMLFGYVEILKQIFPAELSWVATIISAPLTFLQCITLIWFVIEAKDKLVKAF